MKKSILSLSFTTLFLLASCGGGKTPIDSISSIGNSSTGGSSLDANYSNVTPLDLGTGFNSAYYPDTSKVKLRSGKVDVTLVFEGTEPGWEAIATEYERLMKGGVVVALDTKYSSDTYADKLQYEMTNSKTDWDIVEGNLGGANTDSTCIDMYSSIFTNNAYCANKKWNTVLEDNAYTTLSTSGTRILNSQYLQTAFFVNKVAMNKAGEKGYKNSNGAVANPVTWDDLLSLCSCMVQAGYPNPLGISLDDDSVGSTQFTWLERIYGDYYYRNEYDESMIDVKDSTGAVVPYHVDLTSQDPEQHTDYDLCYTKLFSKTLDPNSSLTYVGAKSAKYREYLEQFQGMKPYLMLDAASTSFSEMRSMFQTQSKGTSSPQVMLDYAGEGLAYTAKDDDSFSVDFFDYPKMISKGGYIKEGTLMRDVGGSGGYLSIIGHNSEQNALNLDFLKFFLTPYGQSIYYKALAATSAVPQGLTTVINDYVLIPEKWQSFFKTDKITFTGLSDSNPYVALYLRYLGTDNDSPKDHNKLMKRYLTGTGTDALTTNGFMSSWHDALMTAWPIFASNQGWNVNCYKYPGESTTYGG